jgi:hypothetical protein
MQTNLPLRKLYALLVGINEYNQVYLLQGQKVNFPKLQGCVRDVQRINDYLLTESAFEPHIRTLTDLSATKDSIVNLFKEHLGKAEENDVAFFYFSGHGTQEFADRTIFSSETDGRHEDIVCYYDQDISNDYLLADKELRWLIRKLAVKKVHIVTIFDCCHSGDNTRNGYLLQNSFQQTREKRVRFVFPQRKWEDFIFSSEINKDELIRQGEFATFPEGNHIQFAACESDESAVEIGGEAVFTKILLKVLYASGGKITYHSLAGRIRLYMKNVYEQKPKIYVGGGRPNDIFGAFLGKPFEENNKSYGEVIYNDAQGWGLNLGAIHGLSLNTPPFEIIDHDDPSQTLVANIRFVNVDTSLLQIDYDLDRNRIYRARIDNLDGELIHIFFARNDACLVDQENLFVELFSSKNSFIEPVNKEKNAQYTLRYLNGKYFLTYPADMFRPLIRPVDANEPGALSKILFYLRQIHEWERIKNLANQPKENLIPENALQVEVAIGDNDYKIIETNEQILINYLKIDNEWSNTLRIRLTNISNVNIYCSALYLPSNFRSFADFLLPQVKMLSPNESVSLGIKEKSRIKVKLDVTMLNYNWQQQLDYLKFIVSTENFDISLLQLPPLPAPDTPENYMGLETEPDEHIVSINNKGWVTKTIMFVLKNPVYNEVDQLRLEAMLTNPRTADFALGIYFEPESNGFYTNNNLKPGIKILTTQTSTTNNIENKGVIVNTVIDLANWWARNQRNVFYKRAFHRFPNRIKIVSEGDSWFQHPLVLDIIDHLHRVFNIFCVAAAGDTLRNYLSQSEENGKFFMDALEENNPEFFLISGGGNDILGAKFQTYLTNEPYRNNPDKVPALFLKKEIFDEIDGLMNIYDTMFDHIKTHKPRLHVIVHGYDYPVKLNDAKRGWLGRYMIENGINDAADRRAIIRYILDLFNQKLCSACAKYDHVCYLDIRNMVRYNEEEAVDQWYDEIHPNNDGFQQIAMKFIQTINHIAATEKKNIHL